MRQEGLKKRYTHRVSSSQAICLKLLLMFIALIFLVVPPSYAASFDCSKAATEMEKTICLDPKLSALDEDLAKVYGEIKSQLKGDAEALTQLTQSQREWLAGLTQKKDGNIACAASKECLTISYQKRIEELQTKKNSPRKEVNRNNETQYTFVKGKGIPVCEDYYKNLVSFESYDIICERKINPEFSDFTKPKWIKLNLAENKGLLQQIIKFRGYSSQSADDKKIMGWILKKDQRFPLYSTVKMYFSKIDINNDFRPDNIILFSAGSCEDMRRSEKFIVVLTEDKNRIDIEKTKQILINPPIFQAKDSRIIGIDFTFHDIFHYKNRTYFDRWAVSKGIPEFNQDTVSVYELSNNKAEELCRFKCNYGGWYSELN